MDPTVKNVVFWLVIVASAFFLWQTVKSGPSRQGIPEISYSEFLSQVEGGNVSRVTISGNRIAGQDRSGHSFQLMGPSSQDGMLAELHQKNVEVWFKDPANNSGSASLLNLAPLILLAALWFFMIRQMKQKSNPSQIDSSYPK